MKYRFNDYPFNMMTWLNKSTIEAHFNVGNPHENDIIQYGIEQYKIKKVEYFHDTYTLTVEKIVDKF